MKNLFISAINAPSIQNICVYVFVSPLGIAQVWSQKLLFIADCNLQAVLCCLYVLRSLIKLVASSPVSVPGPRKTHFL